MHRLVKGVFSPVLPSDPGMALTFAPKVTVTKGRHKTDTTKMDKLYWEHVSIAHERYRSQADLVRGIVRDPVEEADRHGPLGVEIEGVVVNKVVYHHQAPCTCNITVYCPFYMCNSNIIVMIESVTGQLLICTGLQIRIRDMLEHI
ncbi:hypothetical protein M9H77_32180 [Catharanthus roseus]|uniref:Uncharacterized protein n=1 Tax=Catharanthus roseus TaxID=4058 RepID=A0ACC0A4M1_CATRO|nr:hypothetical protein M9H77_32180 [Catharanthus roseus]